MAPALALINPGAQTTLAGQQVNLPLSAGGGTAPYTWTVTGLPSGLIFDSASALVVGMPDAADITSTVIVTVTDAAGRSDRAAFAWAVLLATPTELAAHADEPQTVTLMWNSVPGATAYRVYRDGVLVATTGSGTGLFDRQLDGGTAYRYRVTAVGADGLGSAPSAEVTVTTMPTPVSPENYAACKQIDTEGGCAYIASSPADALYPSIGSNALTDGVHGDNAFGPAWQGRPHTDPYSFTVDLGVSRPISEVNSSWLQKQNQGVELPASVTYAFSNDGHSFTDIAVVSRPYVSGDDQVKTYSAVDVKDTARYVRVTVVGSGGFSLIDEIEVRGVVALELPALTLSKPTAEPVDQNLNVSALTISVAESVGPLTFSADGLPDGLTIDRATGVITGFARQPARTPSL